MDEFFEYWEILPQAANYESIGQVNYKSIFFFDKQKLKFLNLKIYRKLSDTSETYKIQMLAQWI